MIIKILLYRLYLINDINLNGIVFRKFIKKSKKRSNIKLTIYFNIDRYQAKLLRIGVLLHDIGFTVSMDHHELEGAKIANELMTEFEFAKSEIKFVTQLILATELPQKPKNLMERIICDVDLDYLGRKDFYEISDLLYQELLERSEFFDKTQWNRIQIAFLENHTYHTEFARKKRQGLKEQRIDELKYMVSFQDRKIV